MIKKALFRNAYYVFDCTCENNIPLEKNISLEKANEIWWLNKLPKYRYQILHLNSKGETKLDFYSIKGNIIVPNGFSSILVAKSNLEIPYRQISKPKDNHIIIDTFTGKKFKT
ncbi:MAG: hypothetical protein QM737_09890 [Ferruginibacter sp.]